MPLITGRRLGPYQIDSLLGTGGMGEVYRARDTKLNREVALKILPEAFGRDAERMARFDREAQLLASLNHPNIASIFGLEDSSGTRALVMELVPGPTLAERIAEEPISPREALQIAKQITEALECAHEHGIIHRDLKPANVKLTSDGAAKILDFGLAKVLQGDADCADKSRTISVATTQTGMVLGTAAYMSPEQARGRPVDKRTDIWSFGCVFFETLTGRRAFPGETLTDILAAIVDLDPDWSALPAGTPKNIRVLLERCLQKDPKQRLHDIADARIEIEETLRRPAKEATPELSVAPAGRKWLLATAASAGVLGGALLTWSLMRATRSAESNVPHLTSVARLTHDPDYSRSPTWSPDGTTLAFSSNRSGNYEIYVRRVEGGQEVNVTNDPGQDIQPAFSPDGNWIAFVSTRSSRSAMVQIAAIDFEFRTYGGDIWLVPALGGQARLLARDGNYPAWHPHGTKVVYVSGPENHRALMEVTIDSGATKAVLPTASSNWEIIRAHYSPDGRWITFETYERKIFIMSAEGGEPRQLLDGISHVWDPSGHRLYYCVPGFSGGTSLFSVEIEESSGKLKGDTKSAGLVTAILRELAISGDGRHVAATEFESSRNLTRLPLNASGDAPAGLEEVLSRGLVFDHEPSVSPDNKTVAFISDRLGHNELWMVHLDTRRLERLHLPGRDTGEEGAQWFPDGKKLEVLRRYPDGKVAPWVVFADGSHGEELLSPRDDMVLGTITPVSPDGRTVIYSIKSQGFFQLFLIDVATRQSRQLTFTPGDKYSGSWSPDGRWLVYPSNVGGAVQLWRIAASGGAPEQITNGNDRIRHMFYSRDGRWIYFQPNHQNIYRMPATGGAARQVTHFADPTLFLEEPTISPDSRYLYYCRTNGGSSLWLLTVGAGKSESAAEK